MGLKTIYAVMGDRYVLNIPFMDEIIFYYYFDGKIRKHKNRSVRRLKMNIDLMCYVIFIFLESFVYVLKINM